MILVPSRGPQDWRALLADPLTQWRAGYSAICAAHCWEAAKGLPPEVAAVLGPGSRLLLAIPEHQVALPGGGRPSQCDVFALVRNDRGTTAVAVEAKVREPFGPLLSDWLAEASPGKHTRLAAIGALLGRDAPPGHLRYQLLHRTAAAVTEARRFGTGGAAMVVQSFAPDALWYSDFAAFCDWLGGAAPAVGTGADHSLPDGRILRLGWAHSPLPVDPAGLLP